MIVLFLHCVCTNFSLNVLIVYVPEGACTGRAECTQVTLFPCKYWVFEEKCDLGRFGAPRAKTRFGKLPKMAEDHWEKLCCRAVYARILKTPRGKTTDIPLASSPSIPIFPWVAPKEPFWPFFGRGGSRTDPKTPIWPPRKNSR